MPLVPFGIHKISRLIVGGNPVSGTSHLTSQLSREMVDYFTSENVKRMLRDCEKAGINTWQSRGDRHIIRLLHEYKQEGGTIRWIAQSASEIIFQRNVGEMVAEGAIGIYHHGSRTDALWKDGKTDELRDNLARLRQTGKRVGLGTHIPEVIDYAESKGWDIDFYMSCVYNLSRSEEEKAKVAGAAFKGELFRDEDREAMLERVRRTSKQCLIFKVYGATRHCDSPERMRKALELVFRYAKPHDVVVIGMFPKHKEQIRENCRLVVDAISRNTT
jgi:hypothetical protein